MNHRTPYSSPSYGNNGSSDVAGSYFSASRRSSHDSSGYLDTGDVSGYHSARAGDDHSMLYYKDKPLQHKSMVAAILYKIKRDPWKAVSIVAILLSLFWGYQGHSRTAKLLKELNVKTFNHALVKIQHHHKGSRHLHSNTASKETKELFAAQEKWVKRDTAWRHHVEKLQNHTQKESRRAVIEKFGPGPHHIQIKVVLPKYQKPQGNYTEEEFDTFEVELAPIKEVPHSVHLFLEQVSHGLWNKPDMHFHLNTAHILMAGPTTKPAREVFQDYGLAHLAFPEYSPSFPHEQFTLGFAGRPGGPSFYINSSNNTKVHGPGGQKQHALHEYADSCFAKVVSGFNVLEEIIEETDVKHKTKIIGMKIIEWNEEYTEKDDEHWHKTIKDLDITMKDDDYTDDMYYDSADEAGLADDDKLADLHDKKKLDDAEKEKRANDEHVVHHHHHSEEYLEDQEILSEEPPERVEPPPEIKVHLEKVQ